jgi:EmrB/QacA subfamily drug resistance transporter
MTTLDAVSVPDLEDRARPTQGWFLLVVLSLAQFMVALDVTVVNVALPSITRSLSFGAGQSQWVVTGYLLCTGGLTLLGGRTADLFGRRRVLLGGLALFTTASLASGLSSSATMLIVARGAQGVGAALLSPAALATIMAAYQGSRRTVALSTWGAIGAGGFAIGLFVGGMLTTWLSWHWIFFINVPVGMAAMMLIPFLAPKGTATGASQGRTALATPLLLTSGLMAAVYAINAGPVHGWTSTQTLLAALVSLILLGVFAAVEAGADRPLVPRSIWRNRPLLTGTMVMFGVTAVLGGTLFVATFFLQQSLHTSPLRTGLDYLPFAVVIGLASHMGPRLLARFDARLVATAALLLVSAGTLLLAVAPAQASYTTDLLLGFLVLAAGTGLSFVAASITAMAKVDPADTGAASGFLSTGHEFGGALGVAVLSAVASAAGTGPGAAQIASGYRAAFAAAAGLAAVLALISARVVPPIRPAAGERVSPH